MRQFSEELLNEIQAELAFIWTAHSLHNLQGEMRMFTMEEGRFWKSDQTAMEVWFGPKDVASAAEKVMMYYRRATPPNSTLILDPIVYRREAGTKDPVPVGSGIVWTTIISPRGPLPQDAIDRLKFMGVFMSNIEMPDNPQAALKVIGITNVHSTAPEGWAYNQNGNFVKGVRELFDIANIDTGGMGTQCWKHYLLSGLEYRSQHGTYQHASFKQMFGDVIIENVEHMKQHSINLLRIVDGGVCWNAYGRDQKMFERYGVDVANLQRNLQSEEVRNREIEAIKKELAFIWHGQLIHGLQGKMRLFTEKEQRPWRTKNAGFEFFFGPDELDQAAEQIRINYNAGILPNSPLFLDPFVYQPDASGKWAPVGSGVVWASILCIGKEKLNEDMFQRLRDTGFMVSAINRGNTEDTGIKVIGFLDQVYGPVEGQPGVLPGMEEIFQLGNTSGKDYWKYYLLSGLEYLSVHGMFAHRSFDEFTREIDFSKPENVKARQIPIKRIQEAAYCWNQYDRYHTLWRRFGIDVPQLQSNLRYFNLCARDFELLDATNTMKTSEEMEKFELAVQGWVPRSAVTLLAATGGTGKSSTAHRLCVQAAIDYRPGEQPAKWLGSDLNLEFCQGMCVYFTGEDGPAIVNARSEMFDPEGRAKRMMFFRTDFGLNKKGEPANLNEHLMEKLWKLPDVSIVVIDPARKYLTGDEDDAEVVSHFFEAIEEFAISKKCAMVVVHHLAKGAKPKTSQEVLDCLRGSQVFIDRPRVVIGMHRDGAYTIAGLAKNNIPPQLGMVQGERVFVRDPQALGLIWLPGPEGVRNMPVSNEELLEIKREIESKTS
jgi:hypothetical protein